MFRILFLLFAFIYFSNAYSQQNILQNNVAGSGNVQAWDESVFVHTDKSFYVCGEIIWFKVYVLNKATHQLQNLSHTAYVELIDAANNAVLQGKVRVDSGAGAGSFYLPVTLPSGRFLLRAYTNWMKNDPESVFQKNITVINTRKEIDTAALKLGPWPMDSTGLLKNQEKNHPGVTESAPITLSTDKVAYRPRSAVTIQLQPAVLGSSFNLSASVYQLSELNQPENDILMQELVIQLQHWTKSTTFKNNVAGKAIDFLPEMNGMLVKVIARKSGSAAPAAGVPVYLSVRGKLANVQVGKTNENGEAYFNYRDLFGPTQLVIQTDPEYRSAVDFSVEKSYLKKTVPFQLASTTLINTEMDSALEALHNHTLVTETYSGKLLDSFAITNQDSTSFYGKPFKTYLLDNYKRFVTMEEVIREYVNEVNVRIRNKDYYFQTFNRQYFDLGKYMTLEYMMTQGQPLVLLDGVPVFDNNKIMAYNPMRVRKLEVVADRFQIGPKIWDGVMSFVTYKGMLEDFKLNPDDVVVDFNGWQRRRYFYAPDYSVLEIKNSRIPDFRDVLYWNPAINLSSASQLHFYTGDLTGKFVVVVQGISATGLPVFETTTFEVVR